jgi:hypothetical protein
MPAGGLGWLPEPAPANLEAECAHRRVLAAQIERQLMAPA